MKTFCKFLKLNLNEIRYPARFTTTHYYCARVASYPFGLAKKILYKMKLRYVNAVFIALIISGATQTANMANGLPYERVWLRIKSDPRLKNLFDWTEFSAAKGEKLGDAIEARSLSSPMGDQLHLYRLEQINLSQTIESLQLKQGEKFYLTDQDLMTI